VTDDDRIWLEGLKAGENEHWKSLWFRVIVPEVKAKKNSELMRRYSLTDGDLNGMLFADMVGRGKFDLYRGEGSLEGWLRKYVRGYILNADPMKHGEISIEGAYDDGEGGSEAMEIPKTDNRAIFAEAWRMTLWCFRKLWNEDPVRCYIHVLKTRYFMSSKEICDMLELSSPANVDQIFSRSIKFMRELASRF